MKNKYFLYGTSSLIIAALLYVVKIWMYINNNDYYSGTGWLAVNVNYIELLLWIFFFATIGTQLIIIGFIKKK